MFNIDLITIPPVRTKFNPEPEFGVHLLRPLDLTWCTLWKKQNKNKK